MIENIVPSISFFKNDTHWKQTIYITGLPRSGKSTLLNVLGSCKNVETLEEPLDLTILAQKGSRSSTDSKIYLDYLDSYMTLMENSFSELIMGRTYNFRKNDKSYIYNTKSEDDVAQAQSLVRRSDFLNYVSKESHSLLIAYNDIENALQFICERAPNPTIIALSRNTISVANDIYQKGWFTDDNLSAQSTFTPPYNLIESHLGKKIYIPYLIGKENLNLFMMLDDFNRSLMYATLQKEELNTSLKTRGNAHIEISFSELMRNPNKVCTKIIEDLYLTETEITLRNIDCIKPTKTSLSTIPASTIEKSLIQYFETINLEANYE